MVKAESIRNNTSNNWGTHVHCDLLFQPSICEASLLFHLATTKEVQLGNKRSTAILAIWQSSSFTRDMTPVRVSSSSSFHFGFSVFAWRKENLKFPSLGHVVGFLNLPPSSPWSRPSSAPGCPPWWAFWGRNWREKKITQSFTLGRLFLGLSPLCPWTWEGGSGKQG